MKLKHNFLIFIFIILYYPLYSANYPHEIVNIPGIENPVDIAISPNGLQMLIVDWPKKDKIILKLSKRLSPNQNWTKAEKIETINKYIKEGNRFAGPFFSFNGKRLYFAADIEGTLGGMDIFYCTKNKHGKWSEPINFGKPINSEADENYPSVTGNNRELFFTREIEMDNLEDYKTGELWTCIKNSDEKWNTPQKLNIEINNGGIAYAKVYDDNYTLLYSKIDHNDESWRIHWTKKFNKIHWYLPVKLDTLISKDNEIAPLFCKSDGFLYYIILEDKRHPRGEIFRYSLDNKYQPDKTIVVNGKISDKKTKNPLQANVLVTDPIMGDIHYFTTSEAQTGEWWTLIRANDDYMFHVFANDYSHIYDLYPKNRTKSNSVINYQLFPEILTKLNIYDIEELWPIEGDVEIYKDQTKTDDIDINRIRKGQYNITLPLGSNYTIRVNADYYKKKELKLNLSEIVLFDKFIHDIELVPIKRNLEFNVADKETHNPLVANIEIYNEHGEKQEATPIKGNMGLYGIALHDGKEYDIEIRGPKGFAFKHLTINLKEEANLYRKQILLEPLTIKVPIILNNINFEFNSSDLLESSFPELKRVIQLLTDNPEIHVEIMAHTDDVGSKTYNKVLANKRAQSVVNHLIINGIAPGRLASVGYGESKPLVPNTSEENRAKNRRVEMQILDKQNKTFMIEKRIDN